MSDRKSKPRAVKDSKRKEEIGTNNFIEDTPPAQEQTQSKKTISSAPFPTPKSKTSSTNKSSIRKLITGTTEPEEVLYMEKGIKQDEQGEP